MGLIKCPECGKEISDMAQSCPNCGRPMQVHEQEKPARDLNQQPNAVNYATVQPKVRKKKGHGCLVTVLIFIGIIVICGIVGATASSKGKNGETKSEQPKNQESTEAGQESGTSIALGKEGEITENVMLKVNDITETDSVSAANGLMVYKPDSGKYAVINVTISNNSKSSQNLLLNYFKLIGPDDAEYVATIVAVADDKFITVDTINPNLDITGNLLFEIPKDLAVQDCVLKYSDYDLFNKISYFELK